MHLVRRGAGVVIRVWKNRLFFSFFFSFFSFLVFVFVSSPGVQASGGWAAAAATAIKDANTIPTAQKFSAAILPLVLGPLANTVAAGQLALVSGPLANTVAAGQLWAEEEEEKEEEEEEERLQRLYCSSACWQAVAARTVAMASLTSAAACQV